MISPQANLLTYPQIRERLKTHALRQFEIPIEHAISLPMPTLRYGEPAYALFAAPALRRPGLPVQQGSPDRWCALAAQGGRLLVYAMTRAVPFSNENWDTVSLPPPQGTIDELRQRLADFESIMALAAMDFFAGRRGQETDPIRRSLREALNALVPTPLFRQYDALANDFFTWLAD